MGTEPTPNVYAAITRDRNRLAFDPTTDVIKAPTIAALAQDTRTLSLLVEGKDLPVLLVNPGSDPNCAVCWDPFVMEGFQQLGDRPAEPPPPPLIGTSLGLFEFPASTVTGMPFLVAGRPRVSVKATTIAPRVQLDVRLIDVAPDRTSRLITRGTYTIDKGGAPIGTVEITIPTYGNLFEVPVDHTLRLELTNLDTPYIAPSRIASETTVTRVDLEMPVRPW